MSNKQSSVEWLMDKLFDPSYMQKEQVEWFEQAKAMHKDEITQAWQKGDGVNDKVADKMSLEYYIETFER
jgi:hypothetical protein